MSILKSITKNPDEKFILRCIELAQKGLSNGEAPFASLITKNDNIIVESINGSKSKVSDHAEILVLDEAHKVLGSPNLSSCTLYTICEPCPMCSFMIREYRLSRVIFSLFSPFMGGYSKWNILQDQEIVQFKDYFAEPPEVIAGILENKAKKIFDQTPLWMFGSNSKSGKGNVKINRKIA